MKGNVVARRYARALFAIGSEAGPKEIQAYGDQLKVLADILKNAPELVRLFSNPVFTNADKRAVMNKLLQEIKADPMVRNFCDLLADKERLSLIPDIQAVYAELLDEAQGVVRGEMTTVVELSDAKQEEIIRQLEEQSKKKVILDFKVNEDILGGLVLRVGDKVFDASLRAQLDIIKENIKRGE